MAGKKGAKWLGRRIDSRGYVQIRIPEHPRASRGYVPEHVLVAERAIGHYLDRRYPVHHVNGNRHDNRPENLVICESHEYHFLLHVRSKVLAVGGDPNTEKVCTTCGMIKAKFEFPKCRSRGDGLHVSCRSCHNAISHQARDRRHECSVK